MRATLADFVKLSLNLFRRFCWDVRWMEARFWVWKFQRNFAVFFFRRILSGSWVDCASFFGRSWSGENGVGKFKFDNFYRLINTCMLVFFDFLALTCEKFKEINVWSSTRQYWLGENVFKISFNMATMKTINKY